MWTFLFFIFSISTKNRPNFKVNEKELGDDQTLYPTSILIDESNDQIWSPHKIDRIGWTATADSEQTTSSGNQGSISNILDGNPNTIWHSKYNNEGQGGHDNHKGNGPFQITINLGRETRFKAFSYMPRQDGDPNGKFRLYEFFTAKTEEELTSKIDESNYTAKGYIDNITLKSTLVILPRTESAQYIALRTLNHDSYGTCAEFNLYQPFQHQRHLPI